MNRDQTIYPSEAKSKVQYVTIDEIKQAAFGMIRAASSSGCSFIQSYWVKDDKLRQALAELTALGYICSTDGEEINNNLKVRIEW